MKLFFICFHICKIINQQGISFKTWASLIYLGLPTYKRKDEITFIHILIIFFHVFAQYYKEIKVILH